MKNYDLIGQNFLSEEEYWKSEETSPTKHEYWDGEIFAMSGGTFNHGRIAASILANAHLKLLGKPCVAVGSDVRVKIEKSTRRANTYPDISIACPPFEFEARRSGVEDTLLNPRAIFEVLSPSTMEFDQNEKFDEYKLLDSLTNYVLVWTERVRVKHYQRNEAGEWIEKSYQRRADQIVFSSIEIALSLQEIYDDLELSEAPRLRFANDVENE